MSRNRIKKGKSSSKQKVKSTLKKDRNPKVKAAKLIQDERSHKVAGLFFLLIAIILLVAFLSYLFTWKADQSALSEYGSKVLFKKDVTVDNQLGRLGAYLSHLFLFKGVGVASFLLSYFFAILGFNQLTGRKVFRIGWNLRYVLWGLFYLSAGFSIVLTLFSAHVAFPWGGAVGDLIAHRLIGFLGLVGTTLLWIVLGLVFLIWRFNIDPLPGKSAFRFGQWKLKRNKAVDEEEEEEDKDQEVVPQALGREEDQATLLIKKGAQDAQQKEEPAEPWKVIRKEKPDQPLTPPEVITINDKYADQAKEDKPKNKATSLDDLKLEVHPVKEDKEESPTDKADKLVEQQGLYEPTLDLENYKFPSLSFLENHGGDKIIHDPEELENNKRQIVDTLGNYSIGIQRISATIGPTVTLYEIVPAKGIRISKIRNLEDDIALSLAALGIRIIAPIPGRGTIGIEVPNVKRSIVSMKTLINSDKFQHSKMSLPIAIGKKIDNENFIVDLTTMPHLLVAGATGQGKSVGINAILVSLLYKKHPSQLKFVLVDPKKVELSLYRMIERHFLAKLPGEEEAIITDTDKVVNTLNALCIEMDNRYDLLKDAGARNIKEYNKKFVHRRLNPNNGHRFLPFIVLVIDEFADLIMTAGKEVEMPIARLAQLARAVGIHLIVATQRPSVNILTGTIKANFPARIAFKVSSKVDSRTILDAGGADQLIGKGDMLISYNGKMTRLQCAFVDTPEVEEIVNFIADQQGYSEAYLLPEYEGDSSSSSRADEVLSEKDSLFEEAAVIVVQTQQGSTSLLQRRLKLGYNRAGRIMDQLEAAGVVGPSQGSKARDVLISTEVELQNILSNQI